MVLRAKTMTFVCVIFLIAGGMTLFFGQVNEKATKTTMESDMGTRAGPFTSITDTLGIYYPGDLDNEFYIRVYNNYAGTMWNDPDSGDEYYDNHYPYGDGTYIEKVKVAIDGVRDSAHNTLVAEPVDNTLFTVYNGVGNLGYTIDYSQTYYYNDDYDDFIFDVKTSVAPGIYNLQITVSYSVRTSWDETNTKFILSSTLSEVQYMQFEIRSGIEPGSTYDAMIDATPYDNDGAILNGGYLYAGASFQEIRVPITAGAYAIQGLQSNLFPNKITLSQNTPAKISNLNYYSSSYLSFRIEVPSTLTPQILTGSTITTTYTRNDQGSAQTITEENIYIRLIVDYTPVFSPPDCNDFQNPAITIDQGDAISTLKELKFTNTGNVELCDITLTMDISDARYFSNSAFYYDEGGEGSIRPITDPTAQVTGPIAPGAFATVDFPSTLINKYLPPGCYKIPVTYTAWYFDTGGLVGSTAWKKTSESEYSTIMEGMTGEPRAPFLFVKVLDSNGISLEVCSQCSVMQGQQSAGLTTTVSNLEYYPLTDITYTLKNCQCLTPVDTSLSSATLVAANEQTGAGTDTLTFRVNVDANAVPGKKTGELTISGYDLNGYLVTSTKNFTYEITPIPAKITVIGIKTPNVVPGKTFQLTADLMNIGGSDATNVNVLVSLTNNLFTTTTNTKTVDSMKAGEVKSVVFDIIADPSIQRNMLYSNSLFLAWTDAQGNTHVYSENAPVVFQMVYEKPSDTAKLSVIGVETSKVLPGKTFKLTVTVMNIGGTEASDISVLLILSTNLLTAIQNVQTIDTLAAGIAKTVQFEVKADANVQPGTDYTGEIYIKWTDDKDDTIQYAQNDPVPIALGSQAVEEEPLISAGTSFLIIGIVIAVVLVVFAILVFVGIRSTRTKEEVKKDDAVKPETKPAAPSQIPPPTATSAHALPMVQPAQQSQSLQYDSPQSGGSGQWNTQGQGYDQYQGGQQGQTNQPQQQMGVY